MALSEFILANREPILAEWEAFARSCAPASGSMDVAALRDHADELLSVMAADLATPQGALEQSEKSKGHATPEDADVRTAAEEHGAGRAQSGFTVEQMVAEYRALRASVIRLWTRSQGALQLPDLEDLTRFNEAIDQSLAESVTRYNQELSQAKEIFLGVLGHDLRTPLGAIYTSAKFMLDTGELGEPHHTLTARIATSSQRAVQMDPNNAGLRANLALACLIAGRIPDALITHRPGLEQTPEAFAMLDEYAGGVGKVVVEIP